VISEGLQPRGIQLVHVDSAIEPHASESASVYERDPQRAIRRRDDLVGTGLWV
jgi:hypothetical protein